MRTGRPLPSTTGQIAAVWVHGFIAEATDYITVAQWPSQEVREKAFQDDFAKAAFATMQDAVEESFPDVRLEVAADFLLSSK